LYDALNGHLSDENITGGANIAQSQIAGSDAGLVSKNGSGRIEVGSVRFPDGTAISKAPRLTCLTRTSSSASQITRTVSCQSGETMTGGGVHLLNGANPAFNWDEWGRPDEGNGWACGRNKGGGVTLTCYVQCCRMR